MKMIYCLIIILCPALPYCQVTGLDIGDKVPDQAFTNIINAPALTSNIAAYKGKLLILDFMGTACAPCIRVLPLLDSLQTRYGKRLQIILVSTESPNRISAFLKKHPYPHLPFVPADSNLAQLFPHEYISHVAWIDPGGIVKAITHAEYINAKNIDALLTGKKINWPVKRDITTYDFSQPLLRNNDNVPELSLPAHEYYTSLTSYMPGMDKYSHTDIDSSKNMVHVTLFNSGIIELYLLLYQHFPFPMSQVLLRVKDPDRFIYNSENQYYEAWKEKNYYCLDALLPYNISPPLQQEKLISDLNFYLGLASRMEKRTVDCLVMRNKAGPAIKNDTGGEGLRVGSVIHLLNNKVGTTPVIDETTGTTYVTLPIKEQQVTDNAYFRKILSQYGFELISEKREMEFLVITQP